MSLRGFSIGIFIGLCFILSGCNSLDSTSNEVPVIVQLMPHCDYTAILGDDAELIAEGDTFILVKTEATFAEIQAFRLRPCVIRFFQPKDLEDELENLQQEFDDERDEKFKEIQLNRSVVKQDVTDQDELREYLENKREQEEQELEGGILSEYQLYVTPEAEAVVELATELGSDIQTIYDEALSWIWVSEEYLNGIVEYWYYPEEFLTETPDLDTNPSPGDLASDCSEQANTLVSLLIASGYDVENVRVVLGLVDFGGSIGGHAWVEIYEDERWFALEATAGAYYDEDTNTLSEASDIPYTYFKYHNFPSKVIWYYYNNEYFTETGGENNAPDHWSESSRSYLRDDIEQYQGQRRGINSNVVSNPND